MVSPTMTEILTDINFIGFGDFYSDATSSLSGTYPNTAVYNGFWIFFYGLNNGNMSIVNTYDTSLT